MSPSPKRRTLLIAGVVLACVLAALFGLGWFPQEPARRLIENRLRSALGPGARVGAVRIVPARLAVDVDDLAVESPGYRVEARHAQFVLSPETLLGRSLSLASAVLDSPHAVFHVAEAHARPAAGVPAFARPIRVRSVSIRAGTLVYDDPALGGPLALEGIDASGSLGDGVLEVSSAKGRWQRKRPLTLGPTRLRLSSSPRLDLRVEAFESGTAASRIAVTGSLGRPGALSPDLAVTALVDLADVAPFLDTAAMSGQLAGNGRITTARSEATLEGRALVVAGWSIDVATLRADRQGARTSGSVRIELLGGRVEGEAQLVGSIVDATMHAAGLGLDRVRQRIAPRAGPLDGALSADLSAKGDLEGEVEARALLTANARRGGLAFLVLGEAQGVLRPQQRATDVVWNVAVNGENASGAGRAVVKGTARGPLPPAVDGVVEGTVAPHSEGAGGQEVAFRGNFAAHGRETSARIEATCLGGAVTVAAEATGTVLRRLDVQGDSLSLGPLLAGLGGRAQVALEASGPVDRLTGIGTLRLADVSWRGVTVGAVSLGIDAREGEADLTLEAPALHVSGRGRLARPAGGAQLTGTLTLAATPLTPLAPLLPARASLEGEVTGSLDVSLPFARRAALEVRGHVEQASLTSGRVSAHTTHALAVSFRDGRVTVDDLGLAAAGLTATASGSFGLEARAPLDLTASIESDLGQLPIPEGWGLGGSGRADARLTGTLDRPQASGIVTARGVTVSGPRLPPLQASELRVELDGTALVIPSLTTAVADGSLTLSGRVPLAAVLPKARRSPAQVRPEEEARLDIAWDGLAAQALLESLRPGSAAVRGRLAGSLELTGGLAAIGEPKAVLAVPETTIELEEQRLTLTPATVRLDHGRLTTDGIRVAAEGGTLQIGGHADLVRRRLDVSSKGSLDLRALSPFLSETAVTGAADVDLTVGGSLDAPEPRGSVRIHDGALRLRALPQSLTSLNATVLLDEHTLRIESASAVLGGGDVTISGQSALHGPSLAAAAFRIEGKEIALRYPPGLKTRLNADLALSGRTGAFTLGGSVTTLSGLYDLDIALESNLRAPVTPPVESKLLRSIALDIAVDVSNPVTVRNNLADLQVTGTLTFRGTMEAPAPYGRAEIGTGGKVFFQRTFFVDSGELVYAGTWDPAVSAEAHLQRGIQDSSAEGSKGGKSYEVHLAASGTLESLQIRFYVPGEHISDEEAMALVATGQISGGSDTFSSTKLVAGQQAASLLAGRVSRGVQRGLTPFGIDEVSLQPELLARETGETNPGARFTFGKRLTPGVRLVYSLSLTDPEERFIRLEALVLRQASLSVQREDDATITYGAGQQIRIGGPPSRTAAGEERKLWLQDVRFEGDRPLQDKDLREAIHARPGRWILASDLQDDADRLRERLIARGHIEAEVGARLENGAAVFRIRSGPRYRSRVEGMGRPPDLEGVVRQALYEEEALERGKRRLLEALHDRGYLRAEVSTRAVSEGDERLLVFAVRTGPLVTLDDVSFPGASVLSRGELLKAVGGAGALLVAPREATAGIRAAYRDRHYLAAEVDPPRINDDGHRVRITVPVREGAPAAVAAVRFKGATLPEADLTGVAGLEVGRPYEEPPVRAATERLTDHYLSLGHPAVHVTPTLEPEGHDLAVVFDITEGERVTVGSVAVTGLGRTREGIVRRQIDFKAGDPLDPRRLAQVEKRLLALGAFTRVSASVAPGNPAGVTLDVREEAPLVLRYEVRYSDRKKWSGLVDAEAPSLLGTGLTLGGRYDREDRLNEARGSLHVPPLGVGSLTLSPFRRDETFPAPDPTSSEARRVTKGVDLLDAFVLPDRWHLQLGYRFKHVLFTSSIGEFTNTIASVSASLARDSRDNLLDPRRGRLLTINVEVSPRFIGSELRYVRGLAQASVARPLGRSFTWAQGYQVGLAQGLGGQDLDCPQLFQVGGPNVLRGFALKAIGPEDPLCGVGGAALVALGQELRYRHASGLGGAVFYEAGNAFQRISDIDLHLRHDAGAGLRYESPVGLLRLDLAFPFGRLPGEKAYRVQFSLGQAF